MKILQIHNDYQQAGGERTAVAAQRSLLESRGHAVLPFSADNAEIEGYSAVEKALFFPRTVFSRPIYRRLRELVRRERPDVAHVHNVFPLLSPAVYRALRAEGVPIVQTVHNFRLLCPNALFYTQGAICERCKGGNMLHAVRFACYRDSRLLSALYAGTIMLHRGAGSGSGRKLPRTVIWSRRAMPPSTSLVAAKSVRAIKRSIAPMVPAPR